MIKSLSPLRYPGGKSKIYKKVKNLIEIYGMGNKTYVEPFAGGFGIGIGLLSENIIQNAVLNDYDSHIYHFWYSLLNETDGMLRLINDTSITLEERENQKKTYKDKSADMLSDGFATLFLNRVNFSGIIKGGPIGGLSQSGKYKLDCRFDKKEVMRKIEGIALLKERIFLYNCDAGELISNYLKNTIKTYFFNIDPPYVEKGSQLYTNYFNESDHINLERVITKELKETPWIVTYDDCKLIHDIYSQYIIMDYKIQHNAGGSVIGRELVISNLPKDTFVW